MAPTLPGDVLNMDIKGVTFLVNPVLSCFLRGSATIKMGGAGLFSAVRD
jgi:hypothetical protein